MRFFLKNTQTLTGSKIFSILSKITRRKGKSQEEKRVVAGRLWVVVGSFLFFLFATSYLLPPAYAVVDPLAVPNNKFGIHIIQATPDESSPAAQLVNANGDWGYITVLIERNDRKLDKWQEFFNDLRRRHLIPLVRIATEPEDSFWRTPYDGEENDWANFLDSLNWPTKNRYVIIYNEPNHGKEWGNKVDAPSYAKVLDKFVTALKDKNRDFFVLNAGFDASTPSKPPQYEDQLIFMQKMNEAVPGIFEKLDGWVSHSYPNPEFAGSPNDDGRGTIKTYFWEIQQLRNLGISKNLPIFITETGWKHAEGLTYDSRLPNEETVAKYYKQAFENVWNISRIVAVTPFLLSYQDIPFDHFSFKKLTGEKQNLKILGVQYPEYYSFYQTILDLPKTIGKPIQNTKAQLTKGEVYSSIVSGQTYTISLTFKNTGQSIWNDPLDNNPVKLVAIQGTQELGISPVEIPKEIKVEPGQEYTFRIALKAPDSGTFKVVLNLFKGDKQFDSENLEFTTGVKSPVILKVKGALGWKKDFAGNYILSIKGATGENLQDITLNGNGISSEIEARYLLPDYPFDFTLEKPYYYPSQIRQTLHTGVNILDFGELKPNILSTILNPKELWKILPFSR